MKLRVKKLPILLPLLLVAVLLTTVVVSSRLSRSNAVDHTDLGQKYLNDMNYDGAITEFMEGLSMDPTSQDARLGLAQAYIASGNPEMAPEILLPLTQAQMPEAYRLLIESYKETDPSQALINAQILVNHTDLEEDYAARDELLSQVIQRPHSVACGQNHMMLLQDGELLASGNNIVGQMGTTQGFGEDVELKSFVSAQFPGEAARVYCLPNISCVVDQDGNLWAAGSNRRGQMGNGSLSTNANSGWTMIMDSGDVAAVAGNEYMMYVLRTDGSLWYAGQDGVLEFRQVTGLGDVVSIDSQGERIVALSADGTLYFNNMNEDHLTVWQEEATGVKSFSSHSLGTVWLTQDNEIGFQDVYYYFPETWTATANGAIPDFTVAEIAADNSGILMTDTQGGLWRLYDGQVYSCDPIDAACFYCSRNTIIVEQEDGTLLRWNLNSSAPTPFS